MPVSELFELSLIWLTNTALAVSGFLSSTFAQVLCFFVVWFGIFFYLSYGWLYGNYCFPKRSQEHDIDPEVWNFRPSAPYCRPSYKTRKLCYVPFSNELTMGDVTARQGRDIWGEDFVTVNLTSTARFPADLYFSVPGDPFSPIDLAEAVNQFFETRPSGRFSYTDYEIYELCFTRNRQDSFSLELIRKDQKEWAFVLHFRDKMPIGSREKKVS